MSNNREEFEKLDVGIGGGEAERIQEVLHKDTFEDIWDWHISEQTKLLEGIEKWAEEKRSPHNDWCLHEDTPELPCDCGVSEYNLALNDLKAHINSLKE